MKTIVCLVVPVFVLLTYAPCQKNSPCQFKESVDEFNGMKVKECPIYNLTTNISLPALKLKIARYSDGNDSTLVLMVFINNPRYTTRCLGSDCFIYFKAGDKVHKMELNDRIDCAETLVTFTVIKDEDYRFLSRSSIEAIRIEYTEGYDDFKKINQGLISTLLNCL